MNDNLFFPNADFMDTTDTETFTGDQMLFLLTQFQDIITQLEGRVVELETDLLTIHDRYTNSPPIRSKRISRRTDGYCRSPCRPTKNSAGRGLLRTLEMFKPTHKGVGASKGFPHSTKLSFRALCLPDLINKNLNSAGTTACLGQSTDSNTKPTKQALDHQMSSKAASESGMPGSWKLHLECPSLSFNSLYEEPMKSIFWPFKEESPRSHLVSQEREKTGLDFDCTKELTDNHQTHGRPETQNLLTGSAGTETNNSLDRPVFTRSADNTKDRAKPDFPPNIVYLKDLIKKPINRTLPNYLLGLCLFDTKRLWLT